MAWVRIDDGFADHPKILGVGPIGAIIQVRAFCYCGRYLTDGYVPNDAIPGLLHGLDHIGISTGGVPGMIEIGHDATDVDWAEVLVKNGLWEPTKDGKGYMVHDYLDYNPSRREILQARKNKKIAGQAGGKASAQARAQASAQATVEQSVKEPPNSPSPSPSEKNKNPSVGSPVTSHSPVGAPDGRHGSGNTKGKKARAAEQAEYERVRQQEWAMLTPQQREDRIRMGMVPPATVA